MRVPQVTDRMKEAPAHALRAVFAGIGQVLLVADRIKNRTADTANATTAAAPAPAASARAAVPEAATPEAAVPEAVTPEAVTPEASAPASTAPVARAASAAAAPAAGDLPVPNYDELSVPSLRARMRSLNAAQLQVLIDYESSHASRAAVLAMFERRLAKVEGGEA
jgi:hypothetical protein